MIAHFTGQVDPLQDALAALGGDGRSTVEHVARRWFGKDRLVGVALLPGGHAAFSDRRLDGTVRLGDGGTDPWSVPTLDPSRILRRTLHNGVDVWVIDVGTAPTVGISTAFDGGTLTAPAPGSHDVLTRVRRYDFGDFTTDRQRGVGMERYAFDGGAAGGWVYTGPSQKLDSMLWAELAALESLDVDLRARQTALDFDVAQEAEAFFTLPWATSATMRRSRLAPDHPAGRAWWDWLVDARYVGAKQVWRWAQSHHNPATTEVVILGRTPPIQAAGLAHKYLAPWKSKDRRLARPPAPLPPPPPRTTLVHDHSNTFADVILTCRIPGRTPETDAAQDVLNALLDRVMWATFREGAGIYEVSSRVEPLYPGLAWLELAVTVSPSQAVGAVGTLHAVLERVAEGVPAANVAAARLRAAGQWSQRWSTTMAATEAVMAEHRAGIRVADQLAWPERLEAVDAAAVSALLEDCVGHEVTSVIGPDPGFTGPAAQWDRVDWRAFGVALADRLE